LEWRFLGAKERDFSQLSGPNVAITGAHRMRVLIVEDERKMAELLKEGLEEENHW
jgi:hypothetical protein